MDATFLRKVQSDFPSLSFRTGKKFAFRPPRTIVVGPDEPMDEFLLLHEIGHALSGHKNFSTDAKRIKMEREAWDKAAEVADRYDMTIDCDFVEEQLDTYRDWLDKKSRCSHCGLAMYQTPDGNYHCPRCENFE